LHKYPTIFVCLFHFDDINGEWNLNCTDKVK